MGRIGAPVGQFRRGIFDLEARVASGAVVSALPTLKAFPRWSASAVMSPAILPRRIAEGMAGVFAEKRAEGGERRFGRDSANGSEVCGFECEGKEGRHATGNFAWSICSSKACTLILWCVEIGIEDRRTAHPRDAFAGGFRCSGDFSPL